MGREAALTFISPNPSNRRDGRGKMNNGDFIEMEYTGRVKLTGEVFDVTSAEEAKKLGEYNEKARYGPAFVLVGGQMVVPGVEKQLLEMKLGEEREFTVSPDEGFGKRNPKLVRVVSKAEFIKQDLNPIPGVFVTIDGRQAKIQSVSGGRVRVDFNHPLAGRELDYRLKVMRLITDTAEKSQKYLEHFGFSAKCKFADGKLTIDTEERLKNLIEKMFAVKMKQWMPELKDIVYESKEGGEQEIILDRPESHGHSEEHFHAHSHNHSADNEGEKKN
jgi:FKBP-type peptidyl-prolyl cis-trans isomerase 2